MNYLPVESEAAGYGRSHQRALELGTDPSTHITVYWWEVIQDDNHDWFLEIPDADVLILTVDEQATVVNTIQITGGI